MDAPLVRKAQMPMHSMKGQLSELLWFRCEYNVADPLTQLDCLLDNALLAVMRNNKLGPDTIGITYRPSVAETPSGILHRHCR